MMKAVQSAALPLMVVMVMMMVSAAPLPPSLNRRDDVNTDRSQLMNITEGNSTSFESGHHGNDTKDNITRNVTSNPLMDDVTRNVTSDDVSDEDFSDDAMSSNTFVLRHPGCVLSTCLTMNLGDSMQVGDQKAGSDTTNAFGFGKK